MHPKLQHVMPQRGFARLAWWLASAQQPWLKNCLIQYFLSRHQCDLSEAYETQPLQYRSFNDFFTRRLRPEHRPLADDPAALLAPADGCLSEFGSITNQQYLQAKGRAFAIADLLGGSPPAGGKFEQGWFATTYLAPHNYHRVHMPLSGKLVQMTYVPGRLLSVNLATASQVPNLFARNERVIAWFATDYGMMAVILVGAMIVGSIETIWHGTICPPHTNVAKTWHYQHTPQNKIYLQRGEEMGLFKLGSTVIVLLDAAHKLAWEADVGAGCTLRFGRSLGKCG